MAELYRKSALEKISSPEQLDKALVITSPLSWIALLAVTAMIIVAVVWSIIGKIPVTVSAKGVISSTSVGTIGLYATDDGEVDDILVEVGSRVVPGDPILKYGTENGGVYTIVSDQYGIVSQINAKKGEKIKPSGDVVRLSPVVSEEQKQVAVCFVKRSDARKIKRGMEAKIFLDSAESQTYGYMTGWVISVDTNPSTDSGMASIVGESNYVSNDIRQDLGAVVAVTLELSVAPPEISSVSGYWWSNPKGDKVEVENLAPINTKIIIEEVAPITKLFSKLKEIWGD